MGMMGSRSARIVNGDIVMLGFLGKIAFQSFGNLILKPAALLGILGAGVYGFYNWNDIPPILGESPVIAVSEVHDYDSYVSVHRYTHTHSGRILVDHLMGLRMDRINETDKTATVKLTANEDGLLRIMTSGLAVEDGDKEKRDRYILIEKNGKTTRYASSPGHPSQNLLDAMKQLAEQGK